jgi:hypothetical protein
MPNHRVTQQPCQRIDSDKRDNQQPCCIQCATRAGTPGNASSNGEQVFCRPTASHPLPGSAILPAPSVGSQSTGGSSATRCITGPNTGNKGPASVPLRLSQTSLGQAGLLLVPQTQSQGQAHKCNLLLPAQGPPARRHPCQHYGWKYLQCRVPLLVLCTASSPDLTMQNSRSCCR